MRRNIFLTKVVIKYYYHTGFSIFHMIMVLLYLVPYVSHYDVICRYLLINVWLPALLISLWRHRVKKHVNCKFEMKYLSSIWINLKVSYILVTETQNYFFYFNSVIFTFTLFPSHLRIKPSLARKRLIRIIIQVFDMLN